MKSKKVKPSGYETFKSIRIPVPRPGGPMKSDKYKSRYKEDHMEDYEDSESGYNYDAWEDR